MNLTNKLAAAFALAVAGCAGTPKAPEPAEPPAAYTPPEPTIYHAPSVGDFKPATAEQVVAANYEHEIGAVPKKLTVKEQLDALANSFNSKAESRDVMAALSALNAVVKAANAANDKQTLDAIAGKEVTFTAQISAHAQRFMVSGTEQDAVFETLAAYATSAPNVTFSATPDGSTAVLAVGTNAPVIMTFTADKKLGTAEPLSAGAIVPTTVADLVQNRRIITHGRGAGKLVNTTRVHNGYTSIGIDKVSKTLLDYLMNSQDIPATVGDSVEFYTGTMVGDKEGVHGADNPVGFPGRFVALGNRLYALNDASPTGDNQDPVEYAMTQVKIKEAVIAAKNGNFSGMVALGNKISEVQRKEAVVHYLSTPEGKKINVAVGATAHVHGTPGQPPQERSVGLMRETVYAPAFNLAEAYLQGAVFVDETLELLAERQNERGVIPTRTASGQVGIDAHVLSARTTVLRGAYLFSGGHIKSKQGATIRSFAELAPGMSESVIRGYQNIVMLGRAYTRE